MRRGATLHRYLIRSTNRNHSSISSTSFDSVLATIHPVGVRRRPCGNSSLSTRTSARWPAGGRSRSICTIWLCLGRTASRQRSPRSLNTASLTCVVWWRV